MARLILTLTALIVSLFAPAQKVSVADVSERRTTGESVFGNACEVYLKLSGDELRKYKFVKVSVITKAVDDQDIDMINVQKNGSEYKEITAANTQIMVALKSSSRKASSIKELNGAFTFYNPSETNGAMFTVDDFLNRHNTNLLPAGLPLQLLLVNADSLKKATAQRAANKDEQGKNPGEPGKALAEAFSEVFQGLFSMGDSPNQLTFSIDGDRSKLVEIRFHDQAGQQITHTGKMSGSNTVTYRFRDKPAPGWKLTVYVESESSVKTVPFSLSHVELP